MLKNSFLSSILFLITSLATLSQPQLTKENDQFQIMTLGTFHFAYPNLDVLQTDEKDQINVLEEPWQQEITSIAEALLDFGPTIIAIERSPSLQAYTDSIYKQYRAGKYEPGKGEIDQLAYRIAADMNIERVYCVDDMGRRYSQMLELFSDSIRMKAFENYYLNSPVRHNTGLPDRQPEKVNSLTSELIYLNTPGVIQQSLSTYLSHPFLYEESPGDFTGVDFETGRWFNRNLRIFRNVQRIPATADDRMLLIIGSGHLNLLNFFFEVSSSYKLVSPLPYLEKIN